MWWVAFDLSSVMEPWGEQRDKNYKQLKREIQEFTIWDNTSLLDWEIFSSAGIEAYLVPFDYVFELTGLFLLNVRRQEDRGSSQAVILESQKHLVRMRNNIFIP